MLCFNAVLTFGQTIEKVSVLNIVTIYEYGILMTKFVDYFHFLLRTYANQFDDEQ